MGINILEENILARMEQAGSVHQLAIFRILLGLQIFYSSSSKIFEYVLQVPDIANTSSLFPSWINTWVDTIAVPYLQPVTQVLGIFLALGLFTRFVLPFLFISFMLLFSFYYSRHNAPHPWLYLWFPLLLLNFTKSSDALSLDKWFGIIKSSTDPSAKAYRWPIEMIAAWLAYIYVAAGVAKLLPIYKGWHWLDGGTSQDMMYHRFLYSMDFYIFKHPFFDYTEHQWIFIALSIASLCIEFFCVMIFFTRRCNAAILLLLMIMHLFLYFTGVLGFMQLALVLSISLINPEFIEKIFKASPLKTARV
jgi:uncharacterized membrane protein YphA (DoxX/SURF4 family)